MSIEKLKIESQQELEQMITKDMSLVEKDLNLICNNVPINDKTVLNVLCHDMNGQLVILQINVNEDDVMLLQGIQSLDYVDKFKSFLKATYSKHKIDDKEKPRLILIAPSFSDAVRGAVESMKGIRIDLYEWEYLKLGDHKGLRLQPIFAPQSMEKPKEEGKPAEKKEPKSEPKPPKKKEPSPTVAEKKEEATPEPSKPKPETAKEEPLKPSPMSMPPEKPKEEHPVFRPDRDDQPKRKLKLF